MRKDGRIMKCKALQNKWLKGLLIIGVALLLCGLVMMKLVGEDGGMPARIAGFLSGLGGSLAVIGGGLLLQRRVLGEKCARQQALHMEDERGLAVAYRAQNAAAIAAIAAIIVILIAALVRGDGFYMMLGTIACFAVTAVKLIAWAVYDRSM